MAHVEALGWATQSSKCPQCHDQAQTSAPGRDGVGIQPPAVGFTPTLLQQHSRLRPLGPVLGARLGGLALPLAAPLLSPDSGRDDFSSKEGTEEASSLGREETKDREGGDGGLIQI